MSDTAETDMVVAADTGDSGFIRNLVQLARRLERERDEARRELVVQRYELMRGQKDVMETLVKLRERLAAVTHPYKNEQKEEA